MQQIKCSVPVALSTYVRSVINSGKSIMLLDVIDKPIGSGIANTSRVRMFSSGNNLLIIPS